jgi:hypothetical protein
MWSGQVVSSPPFAEEIGYNGSRDRIPLEYRVLDFYKFLAVIHNKNYDPRLWRDLISRSNLSLLNMDIDKIDSRMGNHHSNDKSSSSASHGSGGSVIITDGSFKSRRRSHNRKSKSKDSPNRNDHTGNAHRYLGQPDAPRGKLCPPGVNFVPWVKLSPGDKILCSTLHSSKQYRVFTSVGERRGEHSPWVTNFTLVARGEVKNGPLHI